MTHKPLIFIKFLEFLVRVAIAIVSGGLIFAVSYFFGYVYLQALRGNDTMHALNNIYWFSRWWPRIPFWFPQQGAGVSIVWGYPILPSLMVIAVSIWQKLSLIFSMQVIGFLSFPITAWGLYLFVWRRLKNQSVALISAIFFLIMPVTWMWFFDWGFYAEQISNIFIFPILIFYDRFLEGVMDKKFGILTMFSFALTVIFLGLLFSGHPTSYFTLIRIMGVYTPIYIIYTKRKINLKILFSLIAVPISVFIVSVFATSFLIMNYQHYSKGAVLDIQQNFNKQDFEYYYSVPFKSFLGLDRIPQDDFKFTIRNLTIPPVIWIPAIVGGVLAIFISGRVLGLAVLAWFSVLTLYKPSILYYLAVAKFPFFGYFFSMRSEVLIVKLLFPIIAAFGIWAVVGLVFKLIHKLLKIKNVYLNWSYLTIAGIITGIIALAASSVLLFRFANKPSYMWNTDQARYGIDAFNIRDPFNKFGFTFTCMEDKEDNSCKGFSSQNKYIGASLSRSCSVLLKNGSAPVFCADFVDTTVSDQTKETILNDFVIRCSKGETQSLEKWLCPVVMRDREGVVKAMGNALLDISYWPKPNPNNPLDWPYFYLNDFNKEFGNDQFLRVDVSPALGGITQQLNTINKASFINLYTVQLNLLGPYWGYQQQIMFGAGGDMQSTNELAKWFGTKFLFMNDGVDPIDRYAASPDWESWNANKYIWKYKNAPELWTVTTGKPSILIIGNLAKRAYEPVFRMANKGALPYDQYWLIDGGEFLDNYTNEELKQFDIVMLFGHKYHNRNKAYRILDKYVKDGGSLYIDTGWQYVDADWKIEEGKAPDFFPAKKLTWDNKFIDTSSMEFSKTLTGDVDTSQFGPMVWSGTGWGVTRMDDLRSWAKPVLKVDGKTIIAGGVFGKGKVIMSGINLVGHAHTFNNNKSEISFYKSIFNWLDLSQTTDMSRVFSVKREGPDEIIFTATGDIGQKSTFYFRESYFPDWKAKLFTEGKSQSIQIYKAGPGFKLMYLPAIKSGDRLVLTFDPGLRNVFWIIISILTIVLLGVGLFTGNMLFRLFPKLIATIAKRLKRKAKDIWGSAEEENY